MLRFWTNVPSNVPRSIFQPTGLSPVMNITWLQLEYKKVSLNKIKSLTKILEENPDRFRIIIKPITWKQYQQLVKFNL